MKLLSGSTRLVVVALLLLATLLAACGDNTATPAPATTAAATTAAATTVAATTAAATTAAATTAAVTTAAATTVAATTAATTAAATTAAATTAADTSAATTAASGSTTTAASGSTGAACATCPQSYTEIQLPQGLIDAAKKGIPASVGNFSIQAFVADDPADKVATDVDASTVASGYTFAIPGATKPVKVASTYSGGYTKAGSPDALIQVVDTTGLADFLKNTGADDASQQQFTQAVGAKKTVVFVFGGTGLLSASLAGSGTTTASATTAAAGSATTAASGSTTSADIPTYPGATEVTLPDAVTSKFASSLGSNIKNGKLQAYKVTDSASQVKDYFTQQFTSAGWLDISSQIPASSTQTLAAAGVTFTGPYVKNPQIAFVMVMSGSLFQGQAGVAATDTIYMVISGSVS